ncbi:MAG: thioredoxin domain-containing protein [Novosphingobium sp.]
MALLRWLVPLVLAFAPAAAWARPPHPNWTAAVAVTPAGGHLIGNPAAKVKVIEYISYTCPHCARFQQQSEAPLRLGYIQPGTVSVEVRHLVRDPIDMTAAMLTNCGDPSRFAGNHSALLLGQNRWMAAEEGFSDAQRARWDSGPMPARLRAIANDFGLYALLEPRGYTRAQLDRCLADGAMLKRLATQRTEAIRLGVEGTPAFLLDGALLAGTYDWQSLEAQIKARL